VIAGRLLAISSRALFDTTRAAGTSYLSDRQVAALERWTGRAPTEDGKGP
jgi:hypothetical protein